MDRASALQVLGLEGNPGQAEIQAAAATRCDEIAAKRAQAPTDALRSKFESLEQRITEAEQMLLSGASASAPRAPSPLSQTKLADLPQGQQSYTGFDGGAAGAQIHLRNGQLLANRYEIKEQIGAGGMGAVYHAFDRTKQEDIALKVLLPALLQNERARQRFLDEARISARLSHPNIVNVHDVQQDGDFFFLTMELLHGQDLRQLMEARQLSRQSFDEEEARTLAQTLAAALAYAHQHTVHRDIKPENIWVTEDGDYKIMDFGIARVQSTSQRTQTGAAMGTAYYMAPEQLKGTSTIDGRADQYALGVLLYELLSGDVPAGRFKPLRELRKDIGKGFAAAVEKALETRAEDRFADMKAFADALQAKTGPGINLPELPWKGIGIAAALLLAVIGVGAVVSGGGIDLGSLLPMSAEQKAQREGQLAKLQGEIKVLKQRLETARRDLASDVKEAERNKSKDLKALQHWQTLTENSIFNGSKIGELEGTLSMAETLLRKEQYDSADTAFQEVSEGYQDLSEKFLFAEKLYSADQSAQRERAGWEAYAKKYGFNGRSSSAGQAEQYYSMAQRNSLSGELKSAHQHYLDSQKAWRAAREAVDVVQLVAKREAEWAKREAERKELATFQQAIARLDRAISAINASYSWFRSDLGQKRYKSAISRDGEDIIIDVYKHSLWDPFSRHTTGKIPLRYFDFNELQKKSGAASIGKDNNGKEFFYLIAFDSRRLRVSEGGGIGTETRQDGRVETTRDESSYPFELMSHSKEALNEFVQAVAGAQKVLD